MTFRKLDSVTYECGGDCYIQRLTDGTFTAYRTYEGDGPVSALWVWSSPQHLTLASARLAISAHRRFRRHFVGGAA